MSIIWVTKGELRLMIREACQCGIQEAEEMCDACRGSMSDCVCKNEGKRQKPKANPWAVCHASVGPGKTKKFEDCVRDVKVRGR